MPLAKLSAREQDRFAGYVLSERGLDRRHIAALLEVSPGTVAVWEKRFAEGPNVRDAVGLYTPNDRCQMEHHLRPRPFLWPPGQSHDARTQWATSNSTAW